MRVLNSGDHGGQHGTGESGEHEELPESIFAGYPDGNNFEWYSVCYWIIALICATIFLEKRFHFWEQQGEKDRMKKVVWDKVELELMILGVLSYLFTIVHSLQHLPEIEIMSFEFSHWLIFTVGIVSVFGGLAIVQLNEQRNALFQAASGWNYIQSVFNRTGVLPVGHRALPIHPFERNAVWWRFFGITPVQVKSFQNLFEIMHPTTTEEENANIRAHSEENGDAAAETFYDLLVEALNHLLELYLEPSVGVYLMTAAVAGILSLVYGTGHTLGHGDGTAVFFASGVVVLLMGVGLHHYSQTKYLKLVAIVNRLLAKVPAGDITQLTDEHSMVDLVEWTADWSMEGYETAILKISMNQLNMFASYQLVLWMIHWAFMTGSQAQWWWFFCVPIPSIITIFFCIPQTLLKASLNVAVVDVLLGSRIVNSSASPFSLNSPPSPHAAWLENMASRSEARRSAASTGAGVCSVVARLMTCRSHLLERLCCPCFNQGVGTYTPHPLTLDATPRIQSMSDLKYLELAKRSARRALAKERTRERRMNIFMDFSECFHVFVPEDQQNTRLKELWVELDAVGAPVGFISPRELRGGLYQIFGFCVADRTFNRILRHLYSGVRCVNIPSREYSATRDISYAMYSRLLNQDVQ